MSCFVGVGTGAGVGGVIFVVFFLVCFAVCARGVQLCVDGGEGMLFLCVQVACSGCSIAVF